MMVFPSGRVPERAPDWFFVATEACGGETLDLGSVLEVWGYIRGVGVENTREREIKHIATGTYP